MKKGFTMIELIMVIAILGILSGIALPRFSSTHSLAINTAGKDILNSVRMSLDIERHKRILRGDFKKITSLSSDGYVFKDFSADSNGKRNPVLKFPVKSCENFGCWEVSGAGSTQEKEGLIYTYHSSDNYDCLYKIENNNFISINECKELEG